MSEPSPPAKRVDFAKATRSRLVWRAEPTCFHWFRAEYKGEAIYLRLNKEFPDVPLYSLLVYADETYDFDDLPPRWKHEGDWNWVRVENGLTES